MSSWLQKQLRNKLELAQFGHRKSHFLKGSSVTGKLEEPTLSKVSMCLVSLSLPWGATPTTQLTPSTKWPSPSHIISLEPALLPVAATFSPEIDTRGFWLASWTFSSLDGQHFFCVFLSSLHRQHSCQERSWQSIDGALVLVPYSVPASPLFAPQFCRPHFVCNTGRSKPWARATNCPFPVHILQGVSY